MDIENMIWQRIESFKWRAAKQSFISAYFKNKNETRVMKWKLMKVGTLILPLDNCF